ncbi:hypothetical protein T01_4147, partial [Trichinella spiralis]
LLFPLKLQHHATFLTISRQIRIYKTCDQFHGKQTRLCRVNGLLNCHVPILIHREAANLILR